ncbi:hypothetical protein R7892_07030 [Ligilactobacillus murinus]|uniref:hypothetical protein n=1 Tax=Ligilactobacillus murinus TaxID=1622 RepID=UPI00296AC1B6|nr:hypothetical protein [Ligilactobacillus murinus]WOY88445.1 hypothetical protein R7892_07030 [Ligilactobacillus murinus]
MKKVKKFLLRKKTTWELLQTYREHFGKILPLAQLHVPEEMVREIVIEALVSNKPYVVNIPKGCIV